MNTNKKYRRLKYLIHKYDCHSYYSTVTDLQLHLDDMIKIYSESLMKDNEKYKAFSELKKLVVELNISASEYKTIGNKESVRAYKARKELSLNTLKETRDNKGVYVGSGGSNRNSIRKPKKNRSKRVWKIFYEMFPRMNPKNK